MDIVKKLISYMIILILSMSFFGCTPKEIKEPIKITLMHGWGGSSFDHKAMRAIYDDFEKENPDIDLICEAYPDLSVVVEKVQNMLAVDKMPDIISTNGYRLLVDYACRKGTALDFSSYINEDPNFKSCISKNTLDYWSTSDGSIYTLSDAQEIIGYWYNEDILKKSGITDTGTPEGNVKLPTNWDEFWKYWDKISTWSKNSGSNVLPAAMNTNQSNILMGAVLAGCGIEGTEFMQGKRSTCPQKYLQYSIENTVKSFPLCNGPLPSGNDALQMFFDGETALFFNGVWANTDLEKTKNNEKIKYSAYPGYNNQTVSYITPSSGYVVNKEGGKEKIDACIRFIKYMLSEKTQRRIACETRQAPSNPNVKNEWIMQKVPVLGKALDTCYNADIKVIAFPTLLNEEANLALENFFSQSNPSKEKLDDLYSILSQTQIISKN